MDSAAAAGFKRLIVDVKRRDGSVLFASRQAPRADMAFDYYEAFRTAASGHGMETIARFPVLVEGDIRTRKGPGFDHPDWQTMVRDPDRGVLLQLDSSAPGPDLFVNPCLRRVQYYEATVFEDLLASLKPDAVLLDDVRFFTKDADLGDSTRVMFETWSGLSPDRWPDSVLKKNSPRIPFWMTFRVGVISELVQRFRSIQVREAPGVRLYMAVPIYWEPSVELGMSWIHSSYKPSLWYADDQFRKYGLADRVDELFMINRDPNPRAMVELMRGAGRGTLRKVPLSVLIDAGQHPGKPARLRECIQTVRLNQMGVLIADLRDLGPEDYWAIVSEEITAPEPPPPAGGK